MFEEYIGRAVEEDYKGLREFRGRDHTLTFTYDTDRWLDIPRPAIL